MAKARFIGQVRAEWLVEGGADRRMRLLEDFVFIDPQSKRWDAPMGSIIDGASIPKILWSITGSPYVGDYRRASVLHDVACDRKTEPSKAVHRMFYDAMVCDGVPEAQALEFYTAVRLFGPSWQLGAAGPHLALVHSSARPHRTIEEVANALDVVLGE